MGNQQPAIWYFYNSAAVKRGLQEFQRRWGRRPNEDFWRISNKRTLPATEDFNPEEQEEFDESKADSLYGVAEAESEGGGKRRTGDNDSLANDPHYREYYLKQIPFTDEQMEESNALLSEGLYNAGMKEQELLENFPLAERTMLRLLSEFPEYEGREKIYYYLFLLYGRLGRVDEAEAYRQRLIEEFPELNFILDTYWVEFAGHSAIEYIQKIGGNRLTNIHFKDMANDEKRSICPCGEGTLDFKAIYEACKQVGVENVLVEQDNAANRPDPLGEMQKSFAHLRPIIK